MSETLSLCKGHMCKDLGPSEGDLCCDAPPAPGRGGGRGEPHPSGTPSCSCPLSLMPHICAHAQTRGQGEAVVSLDSRTSADPDESCLRGVEGQEARWGDSSGDHAEGGKEQSEKQWSITEDGWRAFQEVAAVFGHFQRTASPRGPTDSGLSSARPHIAVIHFDCVT